MNFLEFVKSRCSVRKFADKPIKQEKLNLILESGIRSGVQDVSIVAVHVMLEAWELGIGSCWVNYFVNSKLEKELGLPQNEKAVLLMPIGYPANDSTPLEKCTAFIKILMRQFALYSFKSCKDVFQYV